MTNVSIRQEQSDLGLHCQKGSETFQQMTKKTTFVVNL